MKLSLTYSPPIKVTLIQRAAHTGTHTLFDTEEYDPQRRGCDGKMAFLPWSNLPPLIIQEIYDANGLQSNTVIYKRLRML